MKMMMLLMMAFDGAATAVPDVQLLDFSAGYCGPCQQMVPILQRMERANFPIRQIDISEDPELTQRFKVDRIPTLVLLVEGKEVRRFVGLTSEEELRRAMKNAAAQLSEKRAAAAEPAVHPEFTPTDIVEVTRPANRADVSRTPQPLSLGDRIRKLLGKESADDTQDRPTLRGQDSAPGEVQTCDAIKTAFASTVRVRVAGKSTVKDEYLQDVGTGTIVYSVTGQAVVLTCAHLCLNISTKDAVVEVEVFENGKPVTYPAKLVGGDHDADLALLRIRTSRIFPTAQLSRRVAEFSIGQPMVSFGCNDGGEPTRLDMKLVEVNRYNGPPNLCCSIDPAGGRSGGGLFSASGELLGVCSCADRNAHEGLYAGHGAILELVNHCELQEILKPGSATTGEDPSLAFQEQLTEPADHKQESAGLDSVAPIAKLQSSTDAQSPDSRGSNQFHGESPDELPEDPSATIDVTEKSPTTPARTAIPVAQNGPEITITIDDKTPGSRKKVIVIPQASAWMLEMLTGESSDDSRKSITAAMQPATVTH